MYNVMGNTVKCLLFLSGVLIIDAKSLRGRLDIVEKRMSVVESRVSADNELAKEMFVSLQQNFDELNNSLINFKDQMCPIMDQQTGKKEQTNSAKRVERFKSSQQLVLLGLKREKQWTRNQMKNLTIQLTEHTDQLEKYFENLTDKIHLQNDQLTKGYSKLKIEMISKSEREKNLTRNQLKNLTNRLTEHKDHSEKFFVNLTGQIHLQNDQLTKSYSKLKNEMTGISEIEKNWTRNQVKNLTIQLTEHKDQSEKFFVNLTGQIHLQNDQLTKSYSELKIEMTGKIGIEKNWTRNKMEKLTSLMHEKNDQLNKTCLEVRTELKKGKEEMETNLDQVKNLTIQLTEHTDQLEKHFENLSDQIHLQNDQLTKSYSKLKIEMIGKNERENNWTRNQVEKLTGLVNEQTDLLNQNFSEIKNEIKDGKEELEANLEMMNATLDDKIRTKLSKLDEKITNNVKDMRDVSAKIDDKFQTKLSKLDKIITNNVKEINEVSLKSDTTEKLISAQQREIEALKETQAKLLNVLIYYKCPSDWTKYSTYCYLFVNEDKTFSEARANCERLGATLSDIENEAENTVISGLGSYGYIWVGYSDEKEEGTWISERTGQPASFTNFKTGQPNGGTGENCAYASYFNGLWYDFTCDAKLHFVCKKDAKMGIKF